ncbi:MAG: WhiB family transcriptional regulator [Actinomycetota bacterium]|nr:WhiB family transcriptional regulator [Actinomycetota bacterium]
MHDNAWRDRAACRDMNVELFYSTDEAVTRSALRVCEGCPVRQTCFSAAMAEREAFGVWGGTVEAQRRRVFRREQRSRRQAARVDAA